MNAEMFQTIYIMNVGQKLMNTIRETANAWADGHENVCMTYEDAFEIPELAKVLKKFKGGCDVIVSK